MARVWDLGYGYYQQRSISPHRQRDLIRKLEHLTGKTVTPQPAPHPQPAALPRRPALPASSRPGFAAAFRIGYLRVSPRQPLPT